MKEKLPVKIFESEQEASSHIANYVASLIRSKASKNKLCILGLATGSSPKGLYRELVRLHRVDGLSLSNVVTFNLDEYYPIQTNALQSYVRFMNEHLFDHVDIKPEYIHIPDGNLDRKKLEEFCQNYEREIQKFGGLDLQILGIGRTGHIGFNEPGCGIDSITRLITLDRITRIDAASDFFGLHYVPRTAITMGIGTILDAREVILMAWGETKADVVSKTIEGPQTSKIPATFLQQHPNVQVILDEASASNLTRVKTPWLIGSCKWDSTLTRRAVLWLCQQVNKPILKLLDQDYNDNDLIDLIRIHGSAYKLNIKIFNHLQHTITGWPGGKPNTDDSSRPERSAPAVKRVMIFSPHPDDDVISMGGTFIRLHEQGHQVHVAYQTSGNIAVFDHDVLRYIKFVKDFNDIIGISPKEEKVYHDILEYLNQKISGEIDNEYIRKIKGLIRRSEAKAACQFIGITEDKINFLNLPFYETGMVQKNPIGEKDIEVTVDLLNRLKPHQIFAAGDLTDPHGTHRVCLTVIHEALLRIKADDQKWLENCYIWLYRGAWQEWDISEIEMAVPLSLDEVIKKRKAIFRHQSQKDTAVYPGHDSREFWQRSEDRNKETARQYDQLGLSEYEAIEAFRRYIF